MANRFQWGLTFSRRKCHYYWQLVFFFPKTFVCGVPAFLIQYLTSVRMTHLFDNVMQVCVRESVTCVCDTDIDNLMHRVLFNTTVTRHGSSASKSNRIIVISSSMYILLVETENFFFRRFSCKFYSKICEHWVFAAPSLLTIPARQFLREFCNLARRIITVDWPRQYAFIKSRRTCNT